MKKNVLFRKIIEKLEGWTGWRDSYRRFVPLFIEEAKTKERWQDWDGEIFDEFFERSSGQCVVSLKQGYFSYEERERIKARWEQVGPLLKRIAEQQDEPDFDAYYKLKGVLRTFTNVDRRAATNRLIASLQPKLLCTVVNEVAEYIARYQLVGLEIQRSVTDFGHLDRLYRSYMHWKVKNVEL